MKIKRQKPEEFFTKISQRANYLNEDVVREVYYEMVRVMVHKMKQDGVVSMPDFGDFSLILHKERASRNVNTGNIDHLPSYYTVKFSVSKKLKEYFRSYDPNDKLSSTMHRK